MAQNIHIVVNKHTPFVVKAFEKFGKVTALDTKEITKEKVKDADILIVRSETKVDRNLLAGSSVKFVGTVTIGTDHIDEDYLEKKGINFASAPGSNSNSVAEYIIAALLELSRQKGYNLRGKTLGVVGIGNVGSKVWKKAEALGMEVLLNDPPLQRKGSKYPLLPLKDLMDADFITLHVPLTRRGQDATYHFFDGKRIHQMKEGGVLINTSRGAVVETQGLKRALLDKHLSTAILDVWEGEPIIDTSFFENVFLGTPHIAGYSLDGKINALKMIYEEVCKYFKTSIDQSINKIVPEPNLPEIKIHTMYGTLEQVIHDTVKQCYDITVDDRLLRQSITMSEQERGKYFSKLRAEYRIRREFFNSAVSVSNKTKNLGDVLDKLGFKIKREK